MFKLKIGDFKPEFVGQLQFYLTALDKQVKNEKFATFTRRNKEKIRRTKINY